MTFGKWLQKYVRVKPYGGLDTVYIGTGAFIRDDDAGTPGTVTGLSGTGTPISRPPHIFKHFTQLVCGESSGNFTTGATTFGSMEDAITDLDGWASLSGNWDVIYRITDQETPDEMANRLGQQAPIAFFKSQWDGKWKMPAYPTGTPRTAQKFLDPTSTAYKWQVGTDFLADSVQVGYTPLDECVNEVHVRFGLYAPTNTYRYDAFVGPTDSDDGAGTADATREALAVNSRDYYGIKSTLTVTCDTIVNPDIAVRLRNYIFDRFNRPRLQVKFTTLSRAIGLEPGMVTYIHNDLQDYVPLPWYPGPNARRQWDEMSFFCKSVAFDYTAGIFAHTVVLEEIPV